jgi:hypothetical protein
MIQGECVSVQRDPAARHGTKHFAQGFRGRTDSLLQLYVACLIKHAVATVAISQIQSDGQSLGEIFLLSFAAAVLTFFTAGLLFVCAEHALHPVRRPAFSLPRKQLREAVA